jgi:hypothetical protein
MRTSECRRKRDVPDDRQTIGNKRRWGTKWEWSVMLYSRQGFILLSSFYVLGRFPERSPRHIKDGEKRIGPSSERALEKTGLIPAKPWEVCRLLVPVASGPGTSPATFPSSFQSRP